MFPKLTRKADLEKAKKQLTKYFSVLNDLIKADLLEILFNCRWESYRQKHRTILDKDMLDNDPVNCVIRVCVSHVFACMLCTHWWRGL